MSPLDLETSSGLQFARELTSLLNKHCIDTQLEMPDFIIAHMVVDQLNAVRRATLANMKWHGWPTLKERIRGKFPLQVNIDGNNHGEINL